MPTEKKSRRQYDAEFKASVVQMVLNGRSIADVSQSLGISAKLLRKWKSADDPPPTALDQGEIERWLRYVRHLEMEWDILKKALSMFIRSSGSRVSGWEAVAGSRRSRAG